MKKKITVLWLDLKQAKLYSKSSDGIRAESLRAEEPEHHTHRKDREHDNVHLYKRVCSKIQKAEAIVLLGPGVAKKRFQNYLNHHHPDLSDKIIACITTTTHPVGEKLKQYFG